jgi:uncharacterized membrane protein YeaQ/YmgE (transglycosylase-associated protein family)
MCQAPAVLIIGILLWGMITGWIAWLLLGRGKVSWPQAFAAGIIGSFVGGLGISLLSGDGLALRPSGIIGTVLGALVVLVVWGWWSRRRQPA